MHFESFFVFMRQLKHHEQKLLKQVNFAHYKKENTLRENMVMRKYHVEKRQDYLAYNILSGQIRKLAHLISLLDPKDPMREKMTEKLVDKLYRMGLLTSTSSLFQVEKLTVSAFCR